VEERDEVTPQELLRILLAIAGFGLVCVSFGASIMWRLVVVPRRAMLGSPPWVWLVAMLGAWLMAVSFVLFEQWLIAVSAAALGLVFGLDAAVSLRAARREER
jgi:hypothetical protein